MPSAAVLLAVLLLPPADAPDLAGSWKLVPLVRGQQVPLMVLKLEKKGDGWTGRVTALAGTMPAGLRLTDLTTDDQVVRFKIPLGRQTWAFEGVYTTKDGRRVAGSVELGNGQVTAAHLEPTTLTSLDP